MWVRERAHEGRKRDASVKKAYKTSGSKETRSAMDKVCSIEGIRTQCARTHVEEGEAGEPGAGKGEHATRAGVRRCNRRHDLTRHSVATCTTVDKNEFDKCNDGIFRRSTDSVKR